MFAKAIQPPQLFLQEYKSIVDSSDPHILLDVRPRVEVDICHLPYSLSILSCALTNIGFALQAYTKDMYTWLVPFGSFSC